MNSIYMIWSKSSSLMNDFVQESVNLSLVNLLSYPYVRAALANRALKLMGGYYDFVNGTFGLWKADFDIRPEIII